ncbi:hypothetical protein HYW19_00365 [Candidatus Woesearchaeota archaeon]|nr:hypothetical protein [Candidatus Woesearchaeota archaeon]
MLGITVDKKIMIITYILFVIVSITSINLASQKYSSAAKQKYLLETLRNHALEKSEKDALTAFQNYSSSELEKDASETPQKQPLATLQNSSLDECFDDADCNDNEFATRDLCSGTPKKCSNTPITDCINNDNYCPRGCAYETDKDCLPLHKCDSNADCNDNNLATGDECAGFPRKCTNTAITECISNDNYCPKTCNSEDDADCVSFDAPYKVPIIVLKYLPTTPEGFLDLSETGDWQKPDVDELRDWVLTLTNLTIYSLEEGSKYHGYKDSSSINFLDYEIAFEKEYLRQITRDVQYPGNVNHIKELNDINICDWVENKGVKEVWIWMVHNSMLVPIESNMAGPNGDISNSARVADLPECKKTYTVYDYNYGRGLGESLEDHGHQLEAIFNYIDYDLFWNKFVGNPGSTCGKNSYYRCGWSHSPPNVYNKCPVEQYLWTSEEDVISDCEDWNPEGTGEKKMISCRTWTKGGDCNAVDHLANGNPRFKIWWMQNMPGYNNGLTYQGKKMRNWWEFVADFDKAIAKGKNFVED